MYDPKQVHVEQLRSGRYALLNPDGSRYEHQTFASYPAAMKALKFITSVHKDAVTAETPTYQDLL
jgi:hypothetical protein